MLKCFSLDMLVHTLTIEHIRCVKDFLGFTILRRPEEWPMKDEWKLACLEVSCMDIHVFISFFTKRMDSHT